MLPLAAFSTAKSLLLTGIPPHCRPIGRGRQRRGPGPCAGRLSDSGDRLTLVRPGPLGLAATPVHRDAAVVGGPTAVPVFQGCPRGNRPGGSENHGEGVSREAPPHPPWRPYARPARALFRYSSGCAGQPLSRDAGSRAFGATGGVDQQGARLRQAAKRLSMDECRKLKADRTGPRGRPGQRWPRWRGGGGSRTGRRRRPGPWLRGVKCAGGTLRRPPCRALNAPEQSVAIRRQVRADRTAGRPNASHGG